MKVIFLGRHNWFNRGIIDWLNKEHKVTAALFIEGALKTREGKVRRIRNRIKRYGPLKVIDELCFHIFDRRALRRGELNRLKKELPESFNWQDPVAVPHHYVDNIHSKKWLQFIAEQKPDIIFSTCGAVIFKPKLYKIPKYGTFVLHEGLTPEYRGLHTPLWALLKGEHDYIGYSLLRVDDEIDGGEVLIQGNYTPKEGEGLSDWSLVGHKALVESLPEIEHALLELEQKGSFTPLDTRGRRSGYFTWVGLSEFFYYYFKYRAKRRKIRDGNGLKRSDQPSEI